MMSIHLLLPLPPSKKWISRINHNAFVPIMIFIGDIAWLVFASDELGDHHGDSSNRHSFCIEQMIGSAHMVNRDIARLWLRFWDVPLVEQVHQVIGNLGQSMSDVGVERDLSKLLFGNKWGKSLMVIVHGAFWVLVYDVLFFDAGEAGEFHFPLFLSSHGTI